MTESFSLETENETVALYAIAWEITLKSLEISNPTYSGLQQAVDDITDNFNRAYTRIKYNKPSPAP